MSKNLNILSKGLNIQVNGKLQNIGNKTVLKVKNSDKIKLLKTENLDDLVVLKDGENLVITYADGSVLVIENFYALEDVSLELPVAQNEMHLISSNYEVSSSEVSVIYAQGDLSKFSSMFEANSLYSKAISEYSVAVDAGLSAGGEAAATSSLIAGVSNTALVVGGVVAAGAVAAIASSGSSGGSDNVAPSNPGKPEKPAEFKAYLVDSPVVGVDYYFDNSNEKAGTTGKDGLFEYNANVKTITFKVGNVIIGKVSTNKDGSDYDAHLGAIPADKMVTIQDLVGVNRNDIDDAKVVKVAQFLQSLDADKNPDNGIAINDLIANGLTTPKNLATDDVDASLLGFEPVSEKEAKEHLLEQLKAMKGPHKEISTEADLSKLTANDTYLVFKDSVNLTTKVLDLSKVKNIDITDYTKNGSPITLTLSQDQLKVLKANGAVISKNANDKLDVVGVDQDGLGFGNKLLDDANDITLASGVKEVNATVEQYTKLTAGKDKVNVVDSYKNVSTVSVVYAKSVVIKIDSQKDIANIQSPASLSFTSNLPGDKTKVKFDISAVKDATLSVEKAKYVVEKSKFSYEDTIANLKAKDGSLDTDVIVTDDKVKKADIEAIVAKMKKDANLTLTVKKDLVVSTKKDYDDILKLGVKVEADSILYSETALSVDNATTNLEAINAVPNAKIKVEDTFEALKADKAANVLAKAQTVTISSGLTEVKDDNIADLAKIYSASKKADLDVTGLTAITLKAANFNANKELVKSLVKDDVTVTITDGTISVDDAKDLALATTGKVTAETTGKVEDVLGKIAEDGKVIIEALEATKSGDDFTYTVTDESISVVAYKELDAKIKSIKFADSVKTVTFTNYGTEETQLTTILTAKNSLNVTVDSKMGHTLTTAQAKNISDKTTGVVTATVKDSADNIINNLPKENNNYTVEVVDKYDSAKYDTIIKLYPNAKFTGYIEITDATEANIKLIDAAVAKNPAVNIKVTAELTAEQAKAISDKTSGAVEAKIVDAAKVADVLKLETKDKNVFTYKIADNDKHELTTTDYLALVDRVKTLTIDAALTNIKVDNVSHATQIFAGGSLATTDLKEHIVTHNAAVEFAKDIVLSATQAQALATATTGKVTATVKDSAEKIATLEANTSDANAFTVTVTSDKATVQNFNTIETNFKGKADLTAVKTITGAQTNVANIEDALRTKDSLNVEISDKLLVSEANAISALTTGVITANVEDTIGNILNLIQLKDKNNKYTVKVTDPADLDQYSKVIAKFPTATFQGGISVADTAANTVITALGTGEKNIDVTITGSGITAEQAAKIAATTTGKVTATILGTETIDKVLEANIEAMGTGTNANEFTYEPVGLNLKVKATDFEKVSKAIKNFTATNIATIEVENEADLALLVNKESNTFDNTTKVGEFVKTNQEVTVADTFKITALQAKAIADKTTGVVTATITGKLSEVAQIEAIGNSGTNENVFTYTSAETIVKATDYSAAKKAIKNFNDVSITKVTADVATELAEGDYGTKAIDLATATKADVATVAGKTTGTVTVGVLKDTNNALDLTSEFASKYTTLDISTVDLTTASTATLTINAESFKGLAIESGETGAKTYTLNIKLDDDTVTFTGHTSGWTKTTDGTLPEGYTHKYSKTDSTDTYVVYANADNVLNA